METKQKKLPATLSDKEIELVAIFRKIPTELRITALENLYNTAMTLRGENVEESIR